MKAGASSMWASCCGLLNEVMGTGAVRGQQPGFSGATGPFRFARNAGYSSYPSPTPGVPNLVCKSCGQAFSVFRKKYVCKDCKKNFCSFCSVLQENLRRCCTCQLLQQTAFQRSELMKLKVKDLRQYLSLRNISTDTCREKEDLVDLVLGHYGSGEDSMDIESIDSSRSQSSQLPTNPSASPAPPSQETASSRRPSSGTTQVQQVNDPSPDIPPKRTRASLSDLSSINDIEELTVRQLKEILARNFVNYSGCCEKWELVERVSRLYKETEENRKALENGNNPEAATEGEKMQLGSDENLCRICMDSAIDCVLLECGHMVTCTKCGKRMSECPICRQYVVRAVHVFKS
ncbi:E3 ubiquitin-protein ligase RNF34a isoform X1 [Callorhinchus milii]|uniref:E3 ubiquitin-protein ligase RNF34 n=1 Tax=Callorhinchus milii TaxID=7868 RepID=V9KYY0_CALMI|nr:E3 ubiquitin-protein ligase RNF34a isoform X1 [Callorhinchus milii]|eukprot:gi/632968251/ref/XP_007900424.1/ PREDICTED: E3 ubiquitin-protein ligase RNF34 isoform X1 [Callorhinchus milii]